MRKVEIGQHYKKTTAPWSIWEVLEQISDLSGVRHLRIRNLEDPTTMKLISASTLADQKLYEPVNSR